MTAPAGRQRRPVVLLRPVPGNSVVHQLWAGTKLIVVAGIGFLLTFYPGWIPIALVAVLVLVTARLAHVSRGALPSVPRWMWGLVFLGCLTATFAGGSPEFTVGSVTVGFGGALNFLRITVLSIVLLGLGALVSWTTNVAEIAPAVAKLGRPLRRFRIPVDDWAVALALALRAFPMLIDEFRVLFAARGFAHATTSPDPPAGTGGPPRSSTCWLLRSPWRCAAPTRWVTRSPRGAVRARSRRCRPGRNGADAVAFAIVLAVCGLSIYVELFSPLATS